MAAGLICRGCGRSNTGGNLVTALDKLTQDAFLTEDGYLFMNPYWHETLVPDPEGFEDIKKTLHSKGREDETGRIELVKKQGEEYMISLYLSKFKHSWIYTDQIVCSISYKWRHYFDKATFMMRPYNERMAEFDWMKSSIMTRYTLANYEIDENFEWKPKDPATVGKPIEEPSVNEIKFLEELEKYIGKYNRDWLNQYEELRPCYTQEYYEQVKQVVDDFSGGGKWGDAKLRLKEYVDLRAHSHFQFEVFLKHIENRLDKTRKDYLLYKPAKWEKVNEWKTIITLKRDFVDEWWKKTYELETLWQFSERPLTKKMIEEWETLPYDDGTNKTFALRTCIFCPSEAGLSSSRSDDFAFDTRALIGVQKGMRESLQGIWDDAQEEMREQYFIENISEIAAQLTAASTSDLNSMSDEELKTIFDTISNLNQKENLPNATKNDLNTVTKFIDGEIARRGKEKEYIDKVRQEQERARTRQEEQRRTLRNIEQQLASARTANNQAEIDRLQGRLNETTDALQNTNRIIQNSNEQINRLGEAVDSANSVYRDSARMMAEQMNTLGFDLEERGLVGSFLPFRF